MDPDSAITERTMYTVHLGNHRQLFFSSNRHALAFQAEAARYASDVLMSANLLLAEAFTAYRMAWPYFPPGDNLQHHVRDAETSLDMAAKVGGVNAVYFQWRNMTAALKSIHTMAIALVKVYMDKSHAVPRHQCQVLAERAGELITALQVYGADHDAAVSSKAPPR